MFRTDDVPGSFRVLSELPGRCSSWVEAVRGGGTGHQRVAGMGRADESRRY
jgi:hypothetical protein